MLSLSEDHLLKPVMSRQPTQKLRTATIRILKMPTFRNTAKVSSQKCSKETHDTEPPYQNFSTINSLQFPHFLSLYQCQPSHVHPIPISWNNTLQCQWPKRSQVKLKLVQLITTVGMTLNKLIEDFQEFHPAEPSLGPTALTRSKTFKWKGPHRLLVWWKINH